METLERQIIMWWRFFSGAHLDGRKHSNATWRKPGTLPKHSLTWWTAKPRLHRAGYRWAMVVIPIGGLYLYSHYRTWTEVVGIGLVPFLLERAWKFIHDKSRLSINMPAYFEPIEDERKITPIEAPAHTGDGPLAGLTFEKLPPEKGRKSA